MPPSTFPDLILHRGLFTTLDRSNPTASAVAIKDGKFAAVGRDNDVMVLAGPHTRVIDLSGRRVLPGLIDNHLHIIRGGLNLVPPPAMPDWSPVRAFGGYAVWGDARGVSQKALQGKIAASCDCAHACTIHGHDHATAWSSKLPIADLKSFWGSLGCACWAV